MTTKKEQKLIEYLKNLKGKHITGSLTDGTTEINTYTDNGDIIICADYLASFENFIEDGFSLEDFLEYTNFVSKLEYIDEIETEGYAFGEAFTDSKGRAELIEEYNQMELKDNNFISFFTLSVNPKLYKRAIADLDVIVDSTLSECFDKYNEIKSRISSEQKEQIIERKNIVEKTLESITYQAGCNNSIHYREIYTLTFANNKTYTLKIYIDTDGSNPREAVVSVMKNLEYIPLYTIPTSLMQTEQGLEYKSNVNPNKAHNYFYLDVQKLKEKAEELLYLNR